jgi:hypothetical protein
MTQFYYGTKLITAWEQSRDEVPGYAVKYSDGYISWSPKKAFEEAYQPTNALSFGHALVALKAGKRVARAGWNGKDMWLCLGQGNDSLPAAQFWNAHTRGFAEDNGGSAKVLPYVIMKTADGSVLMGWLASQSDMLADDWTVLA